VMTVGCRRLIALTAAYAIALKAVLAGFALLGTGTGAAPAMCAVADGYPAAPAAPVVPGLACLLTCGTCGPGGLAAALPPDLLVALLVGSSSRSACRTSGMRCSVSRLRPPSRAPPAA